MAITIRTTINAPVEKVWECWTEPRHITQWCFASDDWEAPHAENDVQVGGKFTTRMAAKNKSAAFDFGGVYTAVKQNKYLEYVLGDGRKVSTHFEQQRNHTEVTESFEMEKTHSEEQQRNGWQAILSNFKEYVERQS